MAFVAVLGFGTVGSGVVETIEECFNRKNVLKEALTVKKILVRNIPENSKYKDKFTCDFDDILQDDEIKIAAEVIGGSKAAFEYTEKLLKKGVSVVTSNKELVALKGDYLMQLAKQNGCYYYFEASVGGGMPIINPIAEDLASNDILSISGILNGTTNYILTSMIEKGEEFSSALKKAQELGYAEADPTSDVEGHDARRKIAILGSIATEKKIPDDKIVTEGISKIDSIDASVIKGADCEIKLIAHYENVDGKIKIYVKPCVVSREHMISNVHDVFNGATVNASGTSELFFYGKGAGKMPTASAVVSDIVKCAKGGDFVPYWSSESAESLMIAESDFVDRYFVIFNTENSAFLEENKDLIETSKKCEDKAQNSHSYCVLKPIKHQDLVNLLAKYSDVKSYFTMLS